MAENKTNKVLRLTQRADYVRVLKLGDRRRLACGLSLAYMRNSGRGQVRCGWVVTKRFGGAVQRNRVKRWIREVLRGLSCSQASLDVLVLVFPKKEGQRELSFKVIKDSLERAWPQLL